MPDDELNTVPASGETVDAESSTEQTGGEDTAQHETAPSKETTAPEYVTREELAALQRTLTGLTGRFVPRDEAEELVKRGKQSGADALSAKLLRALRPEMKAIDDLVKDGVLDAETGEAQKNKKMLQALQGFAVAEEPEPSPAPQQAPGYDPNRQVQDAAERILLKHGMNWEHVRADLDSFAQAHSGRYPDLAEFTEMVTDKIAEQKATTRANEIQKQREDAALKVRQADRQGATKPPVGAAPPPDKNAKIMKRYRHSGKIGNAFVEMED